MVKTFMTAGLTARTASHVHLIKGYDNHTWQGDKKNRQPVLPIFLLRILLSESTNTLQHFFDQISVNTGAEVLHNRTHRLHFVPER